MTDAKLNPIRKLLGEWTGSGQAPQGPFEVRSDFAERGRWILLRHQRLAHEAKVEQSVNPTQQVISGNVIVEPETLE